LGNMRFYGFHRVDFILCGSFLENAFFITFTSII
jgi:hypothetical protein